MFNMMHLQKAQDQHVRIVSLANSHLVISQHHIIVIWGKKIHAQFQTEAANNNKNTDI